MGLSLAQTTNWKTLCSSSSDQVPFLGKIKGKELRWCSLIFYIYILCPRHSGLWLQLLQPQGYGIAFNKRGYQINIFSSWKHILWAFIRSVCLGEALLMRNHDICFPEEMKKYQKIISKKKKKKATGALLWNNFILNFTALPSVLTLTILGKNFSRWYFEIFVYFFPENWIWHFMQIVSIGDNLHEMLKPTFWGKKEK